MDLVKLGKRGQLSIPRGVLRRLGIEGEQTLLVDTTAAPSDWGSHFRSFVMSIPQEGEEGQEGVSDAQRCPGDAGPARRLQT
jgi:bifunctional DNA-binding transcriptional regulator/antitoxin component of YhaV-PrlF toxin-antitoxin module